MRDTVFDGLAGRDIQKTSVWHYSSLNPKDVTAYNDFIKQQVEKKKQTESDKEFVRYYEVRQPIFDFFKQMFFFPTKHCIYKNGEAYQAVSLDVIHLRLAHEYQDKANREIVRHCQSPEVVAWANKNDKGTFVAEVGYFSTNRSYFINPQLDTDDVDEFSLFSSWASATNQLFPILNEPDFRAEFFKEWESYFVDGLDFNPYITLKVKDESGNDRTVKLDRVLSYEADFRTHPQPMSSVLYNRLTDPLKMINNMSNNRLVHPIR